MPLNTVKDLVKIYASNTGTGTLVLGAAVAGYRGAEALVDGEVYSYSIQQQANYEVGTGVYSAGTARLTRGVTTSSAGGAAIALAPNAIISFPVTAADLGEVANFARTAGDYAIATANDRIQTGLDRAATNADAIATANDRIQTGLDRAATNADATATANDRIQTGLDRAATNADATATAADAVFTQQMRDATIAAAVLANSFPNSAETTVPASIPNGGFYFAMTADGTKVRQYKNNSGTPLLTTPEISFLTAAGQSVSGGAIGLFTAIPSINVPAGINLFSVSGGSVAGDHFAGTQFSTTLTGSPYALTVTTANGRVFEQSPVAITALGPTYLTRECTLGGATAPQRETNWQRMQQTLDHAIWLNRNGRGVFCVRRPTGIVEIAKGLRKWFYDATAQQFYYHTCHWTGDVGLNSYISQVTGSASAMYIQGDRYSHITESVKGLGVTVLGNYLPSYVNSRELLTGIYTGDATKFWWDRQGVLTDNSSAASAGFCIDPIGPDSPYQYPDIAAFYGANTAQGGSDTTFYRCYSSGFILAFAVSCSGATFTQNGEGLTFEKCNTSYNKIGYAFGQDQLRGCAIKEPFAYGNDTWWDGVSYGKNTGVIPDIQGGTIGYVRNLGRGSTSRQCGGIYKLYAESILSLGIWNGTTPLTFGAGCEIHFATPEDDNSPMAPVHGHFDGPVVMDGTMGHYRNKTQPLSFYNGGMFEIGPSANFEFPPILSQPQYLRMATDSCSLRYTSQGSVFGLVKQASELRTTIGSGNYRALVAPGGHLLDESQGNIWANINTAQESCDAFLISSAAIAMTVVETGNRSITFNSAEAAARLLVDDWVVGYPGSTPRPAPAEAGGVSYLTTVFGRVRSVNTSTNDIVMDNIPYGTGSGSYLLQVRRYPVIKNVSFATWGTSNKTLTAVANISTWVVGSRIRCPEGGIPVGSYVTAVRPTGGTSGTPEIDISQTPTAGRVDAEICDAILRSIGSQRSTDPTGVVCRGYTYQNINTGQRRVCTVAGLTGGTFVDATPTITGSKTFDWGSIAPSASATTTVTVTGAVNGDRAVANMSTGSGGLILYAEGTAANTATVTAFNPTSSIIDLTSATLVVSIIR